MFFLFSILYGFYKEKRKANKAARDFEKYVAKTRKRLEEEMELIGGGTKQPNKTKSQAEVQQQKPKWRKRIKACCKQCKSGTRRAWEFIKKWSCFLCEKVRKGPKLIIEILFLLGIFLMMQFIGSIVYVVIALKFPTYSQSTGTFVSIVIQSVMFLIILSRHLRAIFFVTLPSLIGGNMRKILVIMMLIWTFQFPASNVTSNIQSAMEGVNCVSERVREAVEDVKERAGQNFRDAPMEQMREFLRDQAKPFDGIRQTMRKLDDNLEKMLAWQRELMQKIHGLMSNCSHLSQLPFQACIGWLSEQHTACLERYFEIICKPVELAKHLCYLTKVLKLGCEWPSRVKGAIKEGVTNFVKGAKRKVGDYARQTFMYDMYNKTIKQGKVAFQTLEIVIDHEQNYTEEFELDKERIKHELHNEIKSFQSFLDLIIFLLDLLMIFSTLWPFILSVFYVIKFNKSESIDNRYIGKEFESIDKARAINGQFTLLPLLPKEKKHYIRTFSLPTTSKEKIIMCVQNMFLFFSVLPIGVFIIVDIFVYKLLRKAFMFFHGQSTIFTVPSIYKLKISGDGFLNKLLGSILHTFEPLTDANERDQLWRECFKEPTAPNYELFQIIFLFYIFCIVLIVVQSYVKRTKHLFGLYFFPDRARPRALYLYNQILEKRMKLWDMITDIQKGKAKDETDEARKLLFKGLSMLAEDKQRCYRCARNDLSVDKISDIRLCTACHIVYCVDCFMARQKCLRKECRAPLQAITEDIELYVDSSFDEEDEEEEEEEEEDESAESAENIPERIDEQQSMSSIENLMEEPIHSGNLPVSPNEKQRLN